MGKMKKNLNITFFLYSINIMNTFMHACETGCYVIVSNCPFLLSTEKKISAEREK